MLCPEAHAAQRHPGARGPGPADRGEFEGHLLVGRTESGEVDLAPLAASKKWAKMEGAFAPGEAWYALGERKLLDGVER